MLNPSPQLGVAPLKEMSSACRNLSLAFLIGHIYVSSKQLKSLTQAELDVIGSFLEALSSRQFA